MLDHMEFSNSTLTLLYSNSQSAISLAKNPIIHGFPKHIEVHFHFLCDYFVDSCIQLEYCSTKENVVDLLTKPLPQPTLDSLLQLISFGLSLILSQVTFHLTK